MPPRAHFREHRSERLEPYEGKLSRTVLRGGRAGNSPLPLGHFKAKKYPHPSASHMKPITGTPELQIAKNEVDLNAEMIIDNGRGGDNSRSQTHAWHEAELVHEIVRLPNPACYHQ
jgi:hypothetical protein